MKTISEAELKKALKGELDKSQYESADIIFYDELARGRVLNRMYKLLDKAFKAGEAQTLEDMRKKMFNWHGTGHAMVDDYKKLTKSKENS